jgi:hypothetical protein
MKRSEILSAAFCAVIITMHISVVAQPKIWTDRPDQSNTPMIIPKGSLQVETGFVKQRELQSTASITNYTFNATLIKFGANEHFEFQVNAAYFGTREYSQNESHSGFGPLAVGVKIKLADENRFWPQAAVIAHVNFKTGSQPFNDTHTTGDLTLSFAHELSGKISLCYNSGVTWNGDTAEATFLFTGSIGYTITQRLGIFVEAYSQFPENGSPCHNADGGVTFKVTPVFQLDCSAGMSLNSGLSNSFVSCGMAFRLFK